MKFKIESTNWDATEKMIEQYPCLANFGLEIEKKEEPKYCKIKDENGKPLLFEYGTKMTYTPYIDINNIDTLVEFTKAVDCCIIFDGRDATIEIYDGYRE